MGETAAVTISKLSYIKIFLSTPARAAATTRAVHAMHMVHAANIAYDHTYHASVHITIATSVPCCQCPLALCTVRQPACETHLPACRTHRIHGKTSSCDAGGEHATSWAVHAPLQQLQRPVAPSCH